jgi:uncharacterized protein YeaO (DUF488 family)
MKRVYDPPEPEDGTRVLVERLWPRGMSKERAAVDLWCREIAPSPELRRWYGHQPSRFPEFKERYLSELKGKDEVGKLAKLAKDRTVTMVFATRDVQRSNAAVLMELLARGE